MSYDIKKLLEEERESIDKALESIVPRRATREWIEKICRKIKYDIDVYALENALNKPFWDLLDRGGKRWRPYLFMLILEAFGVESKRYIDIAALVEIIHNGSLVIDDIEDGSDFRRGKPCLHKIFGVDIAINCGNWMYFLPLLYIISKEKELGKERVWKMIKVYAEEMHNIHIGQALDIAWHKGICSNLTTESYMQMCAFKTGVLARMSAKLAGIICNLPDEEVEKLGSFAESIGIAFQIQDDILNISESELARKKGGRGEDITEGKRTLMVIYTLEKASEEDRKRLVEILNMHTRDKKLIEEAINIMRKYGAIEYAKKVARELVEKTWKEVEAMLPESEAKEKLRAFAEFLIKREV